MIGTILALLILFAVACHWRWGIHLGPLFVELNDYFKATPFTTEHGPKALPWWQPVKVMPWRCSAAACPCWNVFVYTRRTTRMHFVAWRPRNRRAWRLYRSALR